MWSPMKWHALPRKWQDWPSTDHKRITRLAKSFVLAEACVSRTHRQHRRCRPPVLKTGSYTGNHTLPQQVTKDLSVSVRLRRIMVLRAHNDRPSSRHGLQGHSTEITEEVQAES